MENFESLMQKAVTIKSAQMLQKRPKFEALPTFLKTGLYYFHKFENVRCQNFYPQYLACDLMKLKGNKYYNQNRYEEATKEYEQALSIFRYIRNKNPNWKNEGIIDDDLEYIDYQGSNEEVSMCQNIKLSLYLNIAACYLKVDDFKNTIAACDEALKIDPNNPKALYRRSKGRTADINATLEVYQLALKDVKLAYSLNPNDKTIQQELKKLKHDIDKMITEEEKFKGIFERDPTKKVKKSTENFKNRDDSPEIAMDSKIQPITTSIIQNDTSLNERNCLESNKDSMNKSTITIPEQINPSNISSISRSSANITPRDVEEKPDDLIITEKIKESEEYELKSILKTKNPDTVEPYQKETSQTTKVTDTSSSNINSKNMEFIKNKQPVISTPTTTTITASVSTDSANSIASQSTITTTSINLNEKPHNDIGNNEIWAMLHGGRPINSDDFDYPLSYEINPNAKLPPEIEELGRFLETRGNEILRLYESTGKIQQSLELKERLKKAMAAKQQLEKIALLDFNRPSEQLKKVANQFGLDLQDPTIKSELKKIQLENLKYIREWIDNMSGNTKTGKPISASSNTATNGSLGSSTENNNSNQSTNSLPSLSSSSSSNIMNSSYGNNYFISNNYFSSTINNNSNYVSNYMTNNIYTTTSNTSSNNPDVGTHNPTDVGNISSSSVSLGNGIGITTRSKIQIPNTNSNRQEIKCMNDHIVDDDNSKLITDIIKNINRYNEEEKRNTNLARTMNLLIIIIAIILFLFTLIIHSHNPTNTQFHNSNNP